MPHQELFRQDGSRIPSVTEIIDSKKKWFLEKWKKDKGEKYTTRKLQVTQNIGRAFHEMIETGSCENTSSRIAEMYGVFLQWATRNPGCLLWREKTLIMPNETFQGSFDQVWVIHNTLEVLDWKTSSRIRESAPLQLAAYRELLGQNYDLWPTQGRIVNIPAVRPHKLAEKLYDLTDLQWMEEFWKRYEEYYSQKL